MFHQKIIGNIKYERQTKPLLYHSGKQARDPYEKSFSTDSLFIAGSILTQRMFRHSGAGRDIRTVLHVQRHLYFRCARIA